MAIIELFHVTINYCFCLVLQTLSLDLLLLIFLLKGLFIFAIDSNGENNRFPIRKHSAFIEALVSGAIYQTYLVKRLFFRKK